MNVIAFECAEEFAEAATPFLLEREAENNLLFGLLERIKDDEAAFRLVREGNRVVAAALQTDPLHSLLLSHASDEAIDALADALVAEGRSPPGVQGPLPWARRFAERWTRERGLKIRPGLALGVYCLTQVISPLTPPPGEFRTATSEDLPIVARFLREFVAAVGEPDTGDHLEGARHRIESGSTVLWKVDGQAVSIAASSGPTPNGIRVNLVYTPPHLRKHGYASALVAALSQKLLDSGRRFCFLFTDLANPTANKIYRDIGYEFVCQQHQILFDPAPAI